MSDRAYGLSLDGTRVTLVETLGDIAVSATSVDAGSVGDSLDVVLSAVKQKRSDAPIRVALVASGVTLRRIDATSKLAASRADFEDAVFAVLPVNRETTAAAGAFFDPAAMLGDAVTPGVAVIAPSDLVSEVYAKLGRFRSELVASPLVLSGPDGVWLGVHHSVAEVTLMVDGRPAAYRQLRCGGLLSLNSVLGDPSDPGLGGRRLAGALTGTGPDDPGARIEIARYMRMLAAEVGQTLDYWRRTGENVPATAELVLYGPGGSSALAHAALRESGYATDLPQELAQRLSYVPLDARGDALTAFSAALTVGRHMPQAAFINPAFADVLSARTRSRRRLLVAAAGVAVLAGIGLGFVRPLYEGFTARQSADRDLVSAEREFAAKENVYAQTVDLSIRSSVAEAVRSAQPDWADVFTALLGSLPEGAVLSQLSVNTEDALVAASASVDMSSGSYQDLVDWLDRLAALPGVENAWSSGFSQQETGVSFRVNLLMRSAPADEAASPPPSAPTSGSEEVQP